MVSPLWKAANDGDLSRLNDVLADSTAVDIEIKDHTGVTPLIAAIRNGHIDSVKQLLTYGADVNNASSQGLPDTYTSDPAILEILSNARSGTGGGATPSGLVGSNDANGDGTSPAPSPNPYRSAEGFVYPSIGGYYVPNGVPIPAPPTTTSEYPGLATMYYISPQPQLHPDGIGMQAFYPLPPPPQANGEQQQGEAQAQGRPPPEGTKSIPCRYFPECRYGTACLYYHPPHPLSHQVLPPPPNSSAVQPLPTPAYYYMPPPPPHYSHPNAPPTQTTYDPNPMAPPFIPATAYYIPHPHAYSPLQPPPPSQQPQTQRQEASTSPTNATSPTSPGPYTHSPMSPRSAYNIAQSAPPILHQLPHRQSPPHSYPYPPIPPVHVRRESYPPLPPPPQGHPGQGEERGDHRKPYPRGDRERERGDTYPPRRGPPRSSFSGVGGHPHSSSFSGPFDRPPNGEGGGRGRKPPCLFFPSGKCRNGDECRFPHVFPSASEGAPSFPLRERERDGGFGRGGGGRYPPRPHGYAGGGEKDSSEGFQVKYGPPHHNHQNNRPHGPETLPTLPPPAKPHQAQGPNGYRPHPHPHPQRTSPPRPPPTHMQQQQQRIPNEADFPVLKGSTTPTSNGNAGTTATVNGFAQILKDGKKEGKSDDGKGAGKESRPLSRVGGGDKAKPLVNGNGGVNGVTNGTSPGDESPTPPAIEAQPQVVAASAS